MRNLLIGIVWLAVVGSMAWGAVFDVPKLKDSDGLKQRMASYFEPVPVDVKPNAPQYPLPLDLTGLTNADVAKTLLPQPGDADLLKKNGFVVRDYGAADDIVKFYKNLKVMGAPVFITSDSLLHLYHLQFDETLKSIEEREFFDDALKLSQAMYAESLSQADKAEGDAREALRKAAIYFAIPLRILSHNALRDQALALQKEAAAFPKQVDWRTWPATHTKYAELINALAAQDNVQPWQFQNDSDTLRKAIEQYLARNPATSLVEVKLPDWAEKMVAAELDLIAKHEGFAKSPLFVYKEDYSQYVPRGHYTRSARLQQYFKALMWYGRLTFLIKGSDRPEDEALVSAHEAKVQTMAASAIAAMLGSVSVPDGRPCAQVWDRLYAVTAYYVGLADDLTPYEYRDVLAKTLGQRFSLDGFDDSDRYFKLRAAFAALRAPEIYSGTGDLVGPPAAIATEADLLKALLQTQGLRLMGQRYVPDSFMMGRMVYPTLGPWQGGPFAFTTVKSPGGDVRGFPRGLDVMAIFGSTRARRILKDLRDDHYDRYDETLAKLQKQFEGISPRDWNRNLYWSWLYCLKALLDEPGEGYPPFMQNTAWVDKQLNTALGSWAQLRHDTILYAKQSYTMAAGGLPPKPKMVEGYVEPVPEFYARLLALTRMTLKGLGEMKVLDAAATERLRTVDTILARLLKISEQELQPAKLTEGDYMFIRNFADSLERAVAGLGQFGEGGLETTIVADVHTDGNSRLVLEEGTGYLRLMAVAYPMPDGGVVLGAGPVFSYYEFKQPMANRLTDEAWRQMLRTRRPPLPDWARSFSVLEPTKRPE